MTDEVFDLDAALAAQADKQQKPLSFAFGGKVYEISRPLSYKAIFAYAQQNHVALLPALFGEKTDTLVDAGLTADHVALLLEELLGGPGKSGSSSGLSRTGGKSSKSTSKSTTASTRRKSPRGGS